MPAAAPGKLVVSTRMYVCPDCSAEEFRLLWGEESGTMCACRCGTIIDPKTLLAVGHREGKIVRKSGLQSGCSDPACKNCNVSGEGRVRRGQN